MSHPTQPIETDAGGQVRGRASRLAARAAFLVVFALSIALYPFRVFLLLVSFSWEFAGELATDTVDKWREAVEWAA